jgi:hypothetical protein
MKHLLTAALIATAFAPPVMSFATEISQEALDQLRLCHGLDQSSLRLSCYDAQSQYSAQEETSGVSVWTFVEREDPLTGANTSFVAVDADTRHGGNDTPQRLYLRCDGDGGYDLIVATNGYIGDRDNRVPVSYRWGDGEPIAERWNSSSAGNGAFLPNGYRDFLSGLTVGGELVFQWEDYRGTRYTSTWNNVQLDDNAQFILGGCN